MDPLRRDNPAAFAGSQAEGHRSTAAATSNSKRDPPRPGTESDGKRFGRGRRFGCGGRGVGGRRSRTGVFFLTAHRRIVGHQFREFGLADRVATIAFVRPVREFIRAAVDFGALRGRHIGVPPAIVSPSNGAGSCVPSKSSSMPEGTRPSARAPCAGRGPSSRPSPTHGCHGRRG